MNKKPERRDGPLDSQIAEMKSPRDRLLICVAIMQAGAGASFRVHIAARQWQHLAAYEAIYQSEGHQTDNSSNNSRSIKRDGQREGSGRVAAAWSDRAS